MKTTSYLIIIMVSVLLITGCQILPAPTGQPSQTAQETIYPIITSAQPVLPTSQPLTLAQSATNVVNALQKHDLTAIAELVHPQWGLRFSPYAFVHETDLFFSKVQIPGLLEDITIYQWGTYDGSGEPISLDFPEYFDEFVYNVDFANPEMIGYNKEIGTGNVPNNISDFFPGAEFVEYHFSGFDPQYGGMDWQSLRLVFIKEKGQYFLVGIVHAQWTI